RPSDVGREGSRVLHAPRPGEDADEGLLHEVLRRRPVAGEQEGEADRRWVLLEVAAPELVCGRDGRRQLHPELDRLRHRHMVKTPPSVRSVPPNLILMARNERLHQLFAAAWADEMEESPESATVLGYPGHDDRWSDVTAGAVAR